MELSASIIVLSAGHLDDLLECLRHLRSLRTPAAEIIVVTTSRETYADRITDKFPQVLVLHNALVENASAESRQIGVAAATGDIIAFIEEFTCVQPDWLDELVTPYQNSTVVGVGGRVLSAGESGKPFNTSETGCLLADGSLTDNFAADPGRPIEVDHLPTGNMSFRCTALMAIGGIRSNYPGPFPHGAADASLRLRRAGGRLIFQPTAVVRELEAQRPHEKDRSEYRYHYLARRNHVLLLIRSLGWRDPLVLRFAWTTVRDQQDNVRMFIRRLGPRRTDGSRRRVVKRVTAPMDFLKIAAELSGLLVGFTTAFAAQREDMISASPLPTWAIVSSPESREGATDEADLGTASRDRTSRSPIREVPGGPVRIWHAAGSRLRLFRDMLR